MLYSFVHKLIDVVVVVVPVWKISRVVQESHFLRSEPLNVRGFKSRFALETWEERLVYVDRETALLVVSPPGGALSAVS